MKITKKGQSTAFAFMLGLFAIFAIGILVVVFNVAMTDYIFPISKTLINASPYLNVSENLEVTDMVDKSSFIWDITPILLLAIILIFIIINAIIKNKDDTI